MHSFDNPAVQKQYLKDGGEPLNNSRKWFDITRDCLLINGNNIAAFTEMFGEPAFTFSAKYRGNKAWLIEHDERCLVIGSHPVRGSFYEAIDSGKIAELPSDEWIAGFVSQMEAELRGTAASQERLALRMDAMNAARVSMKRTH